ncbi:MAG: hypothetical protein ACETWM_17470 [Candidatus Lokiarchaeia archaeon]
MLFRFDPKRLPLPRGGKPGNVDCPLTRGEVPFEDCIRCKYHDIDSTDSWTYSFCLIKKKENRRRAEREQEEIDRRAAEWEKEVEEEKRKVLEEVERWNKEAESTYKKWKKEYQKEQEEYDKMTEEFREIERKSMIELYGEETIESCERVLEDKESDEGDEDEENEEDEKNDKE